MLFFILALCLYKAEAEDTHEYCSPAACADGSCYCTDRNDGWFNGGAFCSKNSQGCGCSCDNGGTSCQNKRCPDDTIYRWYQVSADAVGIRVDCRNPIDSTYSYPTWHDFCYRTKVPCDYGKCQHGETLVGCAKISAGSCQACPKLAVGKYWSAKGSCTQNPCTVAVGGEFIGKACTATADAVIANCSTYPGNQGYIVQRNDGKSTYYCPGGGLILPLPENSEPTHDFSNFVCIDGYYLSGSSCLQCLPGSVCKYGKKYTCPDHYYSSTYGMSACTRCSSPDDCSDWLFPVRCDQGSTANIGCVSCGGCSLDSNRGLACVTESYEMQGLARTCVPANREGAVAVCL